MKQFSALSGLTRVWDSLDPAVQAGAAVFLFALVLRVFSSWARSGMKSMIHRCSVRTVGVVEEIYRKQDTNTRYESGRIILHRSGMRYTHSCVVVRYEVNGETLLGESSISIDPCPFMTGEPVEIFYDPAEVTLFYIPRLMQKMEGAGKGVSVVSTLLAAGALLFCGIAFLIGRC